MKSKHQNVYKILDYGSYDAKVFTQPVFNCSKLTIETLEQGVKYI